MSLSNFFEQADINGDNPLHLKQSEWLIDEVTVDATAEQLNNAGNLNPINGIHTTSWVGIWSLPQSGNIRYSKIGNVVTLHFPFTTAVASIAAAVVNTVVLPLELRPIVNLEDFVVRISNNSVIGVGLLEISDAGVIAFYSNVAEANFTASGQGGFYPTTICYLTA